MNLLIIRDRICSFYQKRERFFIFLIRFLYMMILYFSFKELFGYNEDIYRISFILGVSFVCAFIPSGVISLIAFLIAFVDLLSLSMEAAVVWLAFVAVVYLLYLRLVPGKSYIVLITMALLMKLPCCVPLLVAMLVGPVGIVPVICGIVLYYYSVHAHELQSFLTASTDESSVQPITFIIDSLIRNQEMLMFIVVFSVVIMVTYMIYRSSIHYSWVIAIVSGMVLMILGLLAGSVLLEDELGISVILFGSMISCAVALVVQFFKCVVDYSRVEIVQFEDDDYYYYVKAVPKVTVSAKNINVKKINTREIRQE